MAIDPRKRLNKTQEVLKYLQRYGSVSKPVAAAKWDCWALTQIISELRSRGLEITYNHKNDNWTLTKES